MELLYTILFVAAVTAILTWFGMRQKKAAWTGTVTRIRKNSYWKDDIEEEQVIVYYRTDSGKNGKITLNPFAFEQTLPGLQEGDRLIKEAGQYMPRVEKPRAKQEV